MSLALRAGVPIEAIIDQAMSIRPCNAYVNRTKAKGDTSVGTSCPSAIGHALKDLCNKMNDISLVEVEEEIKPVTTKPSSKVKCPECGAELLFEGGCNICKNCGWTKCD